VQGTPRFPIHPVQIFDTVGIAAQCP